MYPPPFIMWVLWLFEDAPDIIMAHSTLEGVLEKMYADGYGFHVRDQAYMSFPFTSTTSSFPGPRAS